MAFFLIIPMVFMLVGFGGIYGVWFGKAKESKVVSKARNMKMGKGGLILFGLVFMVAGLVATYFFLILPVVNTWQAKGWSETSCEIISAEVESHTGDDSTTYSVEITYEYEFGGQRYCSDRYDFIGGSSSGYKSKQREVDRYRNMKSPICYVDPSDPAEAVLLRDFSMKNLIGLFPLIFVVVGAGIMIAGIRHKRGEYAWLPSDDDGADDGMTYLKPGSTPVKKLVLAIVVCLFWNGIVSIFVVEAVTNFNADGFSMETLFMMPFALVGIALVVWVMYQVLALHNPKYTLILKPEKLYTGTVGLLSWESTGNSTRVVNLSIKLKGEEQATYRVGTNTRTAKETFFEMDLVNTSDYTQIFRGEIGFTLPSDTMHSFESANNKIVWSIVLHGDVPYWPDVKHTYKIVINPQPISS